MISDLKLQDLLISLTQSIDMISAFIHRHHLRVATMCESLANRLEWDQEQKKHLILAAALHDIGAVSESDKKEILQIDVKEDHPHAILGAGMLRDFPYFEPIIPIIRYHHHYWHDGEGATDQNKTVPEASFLLHLADRVDILLNPDEWVLDQAEDIRREISLLTGEVFKPEHVDAFLRESEHDAFWLRLSSASMHDLMARTLGDEAPIIMDINMLEALAKMFSHMIDFRSPFTATHSAGVAAVAYELAHVMNYEAEKCRKLRVAGYLHDIGKIAVPKEILEKPAKLSELEFHRMKAHAFYTNAILSSLPALQDICNWASYHHEKNDGSGYPFGMEKGDIQVEERILAFADVFTALRENRPYRETMSISDTLKLIVDILKPTPEDEVYSLLVRHIEQIDKARTLAQEAALAKFRDIDKEMQTPT